MSGVLDRIKFCEQTLKRTSQGTFLPSLVQIGPVVWDRDRIELGGQNVERNC